MKINYLTPEVLWKTKMSLGRRMCVEEVSRSASLGVFHTADFDADVLWCYKTNGMRVDRFGGPKVIVFNEANDEAKTLGDIADADATHCVFHHHDEFVTWEPVLDQMGITSSFQPHGSEKISRVDWDDRDIECVLTGAVDPNVYPVRSRMMQALDTRLINGVRYPHPGYRVQDESSLRVQRSRYTGMLRRSKVSLCCTSKHKYALAKLYESAAAGCVIATDNPECPVFRATIWPYCIQIFDDMAPARIAQVINSYSDDELRDMAEATYYQWLRHFTMEHWSLRFLEQVREL